MATANEKKDLWVQWAHDAIARYPLIDEDEDVDETANNMVDVATVYADLMLEEYENRFASGAAASKRSKRRKAEDDEDEE